MHIVSTGIIYPATEKLFGTPWFFQTHLSISCFYVTSFAAFLDAVTAHDLRKLTRALIDLIKPTWKRTWAEKKAQLSSFSFFPQDHLIFDQSALFMEGRKELTQ